MGNHPANPRASGRERGLTWRSATGGATLDRPAHRRVWRALGAQFLTLSTATQPGEASVDLVPTASETKDRLRSSTISARACASETPRRRVDTTGVEGSVDGLTDTNGKYSLVLRSLTRYSLPQIASRHKLRLSRQKSRHPEGREKPLTGIHRPPGGRLLSLAFRAHCSWKKKSYLT
jgi:hypothetical protein